MPRIPQDELEKIRQGCDLADLVRQKGVELKPHGKDLIGLCPFHNDTNPSLVVTPSKGLWHCLGACNSGGSVFDWVMKAEGVSFRHAVEILRTGNTTLESGRIVRSKGTIPKLSSPIEADATDAGVLQQTIRFYQESLHSEPGALAYLKSRKLDDPELLQRFNIGFANRTLGLRLPARNRKDGQMIRERLVSLGLFRKSGHEHFSGSVVIPVYNAQGEVAEIYGRKVTSNLRPGTAYHTYLPGPHRGIFNYSYLAAKTDLTELILCESLIDALSFIRFGIENVSSSFGINGYTQELHDFITSGAFKRIVIAYDADEAGDKAALELATRLNAEGLEAKRISLPLGYDINQLATESPDAAKALQSALDQGSWLGQGELYPKAPVLKQEKTILENPAKITPAKTSSSKAASAFERKGELLYFSCQERSYRIAGFEKNHALDSIKINLKVSMGSFWFSDSLDLCVHKSRQSYVKQASVELGVETEVLKRDLGVLLNALEEEQERQQNEKLEEHSVVQMSHEDTQQALELLKQRDFLSSWLEDLDNMGLVGEECNKLVALLCMVSRKLRSPLALIVQSSSSGGKSTLLDGVLSCMPDEEYHRYSSMSGQSLFYMGEKGLKHKILYIAEEEGARRASYSLKVLQSDGELTMASTGKDPKSGRLTTQEYKTEGPVQLCMTTTSIELDPELQNRCLVLSVDESSTQTKAIQRLQRESRTRQGMIKKDKAHALRKKWQNAQRLLEPVRVVNPFALDLRFVSDKTRSRRDQVKYLDLIDAIALLSQHQRDLKSDAYGSYVEVSLDDIELANFLASFALGKSLDELPPQTRMLLNMICDMVDSFCADKNLSPAEVRFSRRQVREYSCWGNTQLKVHIRRLEELELLRVWKSTHGAYVYSLNYQDSEERSGMFLGGLLDVKELRSKYPSCNYDGRWAGLIRGWSGQNGQWSPPGRGVVGARSDSKNTLESPVLLASRANGRDIAKNTYRVLKKDTEHTILLKEA